MSSSLASSSGHGFPSLLFNLVRRAICGLRFALEAFIGFEYILFRLCSYTSSSGPLSVTITPRELKSSLFLTLDVTCTTYVLGIWVRFRSVHEYEVRDGLRDMGGMGASVSGHYI